MITVPEAARRVGRHPETIRRWIRGGRLRSHKLGTQHMVELDEVRRLADEPVLDLPEAWTVTDSGGDQPDWEALVRDGRETR